MSVAGTVYVRFVDYDTQTPTCVVARRDAVLRERVALVQFKTERACDYCHH